MENARVEKVTSHDLDLIERLVELEQTEFDDYALSQWLITSFIQYGRTFALFIDDEPIGVAVYWRNWHPSTSVYLATISVREDLRGKGLGKFFLEETLNQLEEDEVVKVRLTVDPGNTPAINLYFDHFGFKPIKFQPHEYGQGEHRLVMELDLRKLLRNGIEAAQVDGSAE